MSPVVVAIQPRRKVRSLVIDEARCKGCSFCVEFCPKGVLEISSRFNAKGYYVPEATHAESCVGCALCEMICPDSAIFLAEQPAPCEPAWDPNKEAKVHKEEQGSALAS